MAVDTSQGWGQAAINNSNGFGSGASNNTKDWGKIHAETLGHPATNLMGFYPEVIAFISRVEADGGSVESAACLSNDLTFLKTNPSYTGLLDTYPGAAAAYSFRLLDTSYTGDAIVVRRASDNTTQSIGFVNNELDTATLESFCSGTDGFVTTWYDQSGQGNDATNASASSQPKIVSVGSIILENGKPSIEFDGTSYYLNASTINVPQPTSYFITYKYNVVSDIFTDLSNGIDSRQLNDTSNSGFARIFSGSSLLSNFLTSVNQALRFSLFNSVNSALAINGGTLSTGDAGNAGIQNMDIGKSSSNHLDGNIQEFIIYPTNESANRSGIETNINNHYSIY